MALPVIMILRNLVRIFTAEKTKSNTHIETLYKLVKHAKVVLKSKHVKYIKNQNVSFHVMVPIFLLHVACRRKF